MENNYRLIIDESIQDTSDWDISINISDIWKKYNNGEIDLIEFIKNYKLIINNYKQIIINNKGIPVWNELAIILNNFKSYDKESSNKKFDDVYNWADKNNIEIKI